MIKRNTVFILGAGASWHYGYPTGEELIERIITISERIACYAYIKFQLSDDNELRMKCQLDDDSQLPIYLSNKVGTSERTPAIVSEAWKEFHDECRTLADRLKAIRPLLIDHFLAWNYKLQDVGKMMIAASILETNYGWKKNYPHPPKEKHWYRFIIHRLVYECRSVEDLFKNNVHFITFNYDTSLERNLYDSLSRIDIFENKDDVVRFISEGRIEHVYGLVPEVDNTAGITDTFINGMINLKSIANPWGVMNLELDQKSKTLLDTYYDAAKTLRTIDPDDKTLNKASLTQAKQWVEEAEDKHRVTELHNP
ncbi:MAG: hypothetical protein WBX25_02785 [Rhodomicrobium sp.]